MEKKENIDQLDSKNTLKIEFFKRRTLTALFDKIYRTLSPSLGIASQTDRQTLIKVLK